uniref:Subtilisin-like protease n=1 Tax=Aegilops tauschii TaxID=37682 RepID=M8BHQ2_AEGTA
MEGYRFRGSPRGVAPKARVAAYKVCWKGAGCLDSDILAGFDRAVADGVDVISVSIGGGNGAVSPFYIDPIAIGSYGAVSRGVFVATSAGNEGPAPMSVTNLAPWIATVGAGTIDRNFPAEIVLGDGRRMSGVSLYSGKPLANNTMLSLYYPGRSGGLSASLCMENSIDPSLVAGKIVICDRGSSPRVAKGMVVKEAGGAAMVLANGEANGEGLVGDAHVLPACSVGENEGDALKAYAANTTNPTATIVFRGTVIGVKPAPLVASFSARGPNGLVPEILKPDFIAPGVNILAAWTGATVREQVMFMFWRAWHPRNDLIFGKGKESLSNSVIFVGNYWNSFTTANTCVQVDLSNKGKGVIDNGRYVTQPEFGRRVWEPPDPDYIKTNVDASFVDGMRSASVRVVARNNLGEVLASLWDFIRLCTSVDEAELHAALAGLYIGITFHIPIILETDCAFLTSFLAKDSIDRSPLRDLKKEASSVSRLMRN